MFRRLLSFLGLSWYVPNLSSGAGSDSATPDRDGETAVSFAPGQKAGFSASEAEEAQDQRRAEVTDKDLVWPGKVSEIGFPNDAEVDYRYELTVTDLEPAYYTIRPPQGGKWHPSGGVLLQPGEETRYEVMFQAPPVVKSKSRTFSIVITRFDPRRANDPGEVVGELPTRWVAMPTAADFTLTSKTPDVITRPWRRTALFAVELANRSFLPPSLHLQIVRAPRKEDLEKNADSVEQVGTFGQELESRRSGLFHFLAPVLNPKGSYYATVKGTARVADKTEYAIGLTKPVHVRYVPWLRMGRDWLFLFCSLFLLLYIVWGIPVYKSPQIEMTVKFADLDAGQLPVGAPSDSLKLAVTSVETGQNLPVTRTSNLAVFRFNLPGHWYGYRPLLGWHGLQDEQFQAKSQLNDADTNKGFFTKYDVEDKSLHSVSNKEALIARDTADNFTVTLTKIADKLSLFGGIFLSGTGGVGLKNPIRIHVVVDDPGSAGSIKTLWLSGTLGATPFGPIAVENLKQQGKRYSADEELPIQSAGQLSIIASIPNTDLKAETLVKDVSSGVETPFQVHLSFPHAVVARGPDSKPPLGPDGKPINGAASDPGKSPNSDPKSDPKKGSANPPPNGNPTSTPKDALTPEQKKIIQESCVKAGLPTRSDNPLGIDLGVTVSDPANPAELTFDLPKKPCCFQLYSYRGGALHPLLGFKMNEMTNKNEAICRYLDPSQGEIEKAWLSSDIPPSRQDDDAGDNTEIEYILLAVSTDTPVSDQDRKDLIGFVKKLGAQSKRWSITARRGMRNSKTDAFVWTPSSTSQ